MKTKETFKKLETATINPDKNSVFAILYCKDNTPYKNYEEVPDDTRDKVVPVALMSYRWNGQLGFLGGFVDGDETLLEALHRETLEEVNFDSSHVKFKPLATYQNEKGWLNIHSFVAELNIDTLVDIQRKALSSEHYLAEQTGTVLIPLRNTSTTEFEDSLKHNFCATSKLELMEFVEKHISTLNI